MDLVAEYLTRTLNYPVLVQGTASRARLLERFRSQTDSVLLAVASFWEGVDIVGESLSGVIIDKLPFEVPTDPVVQARIQAIREDGGNPFFDFQIPRAVLSLRQGVGRLMRSASDGGLISVLDARLFSKRYGSVFLNSLPPSPVVREMVEIKNFFGMLEENQS
jgi:ATP-dependent DNA helicase DinG